MNKYFGDLHVLQDIDLIVHRGEVVVVIGPSGPASRPCAGRSIGWRPSARDIAVDGKPLPEEGKDLARLRSDVGMVFQSFNLFAHKTVLENVTLGPMKVRGMNKAAAEKRPARCSTRVGVGNQGPPSTQRSSPAGSSSGSRSPAPWPWTPRSLLFDEPTSALDPEMINEVLDVMTSLAHDGTTMVVITHEMGFARRAANRVVFMSDGQIVEEQAPEAFFTTPSTDRARDFLSKILTRRPTGSHEQSLHANHITGGRCVRMRVRRFAAAAAAIALSLTLAACGGDDSDETATEVESAPTFEAGTTMATLSDKGSMTVGTKFDQPLFGLKGLDGKPQGFDVEIAKIIAGAMGISPENIN